MKISQFVHLAMIPASLAASAGALAQSTPATATPIQHVVVLFQENVSFDHYFGTYPNAQNNSGEQAFTAYPGTPTVNGLSPALLNQNPNLNAGGTSKVNPGRLSPAQAYTCSNNHSYGPEQQAVDGGLLDKFPKYTGSTTAVGCAADGSTVLGYFDGNTVAAYWNYAQNYALNDNSFDSNFGPSSTGVINLLSGQTYYANTFFGSGSTSSYPTNTVTGSGSYVTDIGDFDAYLDDCGNDKGGTSTGTTTLQMTSKSVGDLLNAAGVTWGWFQGGFRPTTAASGSSPAVCGASRIEHEYPSTYPSAGNGNSPYFVPEPVAPLNTSSSTVHTATNDYVSHHAGFQFYASTRNQHHLGPTSVAAIGTTDRANHQYDTRDFFDALAAGNLPAVSFIKAPAAYNGHPGNSDPISEQYWVTQVINTIMQSPAWATTAIIIAYDDSDGWYDHVTGPVVSPSNVSVDYLAGSSNCGTPVSGAQLGRCGHGPRLPLLVISPYANPNYVDHTLTNQASIINFIEANWNLGYIDGPAAPASGTGSYDRYSGTLLNMFNFNAPPTTQPLLLTCSGAYASTPAQACQIDPSEIDPPGTF